MRLKLKNAAKAAVSVLFLGPLVLLGEPTTWWVATNGADADGRGGEDAPFATLPYALGKAEDGDTIKVKAGTYDVPAGETVDTFYAVVAHAVTIESVGGEAVLDGGKRRCLPLQINNAKAVVRGFRFQNVASWNSWNKYLGGVVDIQDGTLADSTVCDSTTKVYGGVLMRAGLLTNCVIRAVSCNDNNSSYGGGVELYSGSPLVVDCAFDGCKAHSGSASTFVRRRREESCATAGWSIARARHLAPVGREPSGWKPDLSRTASSRQIRSPSRPMRLRLVRAASTSRAEPCATVSWRAIRR